MRSSFADGVELLLAIPGTAAGIHGLAWAATAAITPTGVPQDRSLAYAAVGLYGVLTVVFWQWRIRPAVRSGELDGPVQMFAGAVLTVAFLFAMLFGLGAAVRFASEDDMSSAVKPWVMLAMGGAGIYVAGQSLRQALWFQQAYRQAHVLPTSTLRSAAAGPVEVHGRVVAAPGELPLLHKEETKYFLHPFRIDDGTGPLAVQVPPNTQVNNEDHLVWLRYVNRAPVLTPGDRVRVLGYLDVLQDPPALTPWRAPGETSFDGTLFGKAYVFAVAPDDERALHEELAAKARAWLGFSIVWLAGSMLYALLPWAG